MPKIPDLTALGGTPSMNSGRHLPSAHEADMSARFAGLAHLGSALAGIGAERQKQDDALDILKAETKHKGDLTEIERDLSNNPDYDQHDPIFKERASKSAADAASLIRDPQTREHWQLRAGLENEGARAGVVRRAEALGKQQRVSDLDGVLTDLQKSYADPNATPKQRQDAMAGIDNAITLAQKSGLMTPRQARQTRLHTLGSAEEFAVKQRVAAGDDLEVIIKDLQGGVPETPQVDDSNLKAAIETLKLTPQEQNLYQRHLGNLTGQGGVDNEDGSRSTLGQTTISANGKFYNIPTVWDGKSLSTEEATARAAKDGLDSFPSYDTEEQAGERLQQLDSYMEKDTQAFIAGRKDGKPQQSLTERIAGISTPLETRSKDPLKGVANVSPDSAGTHSYGNFGLNSQKGGSIYGFVAEYGDQFGLTAKPGTKAFDDQWKNAAKASPVEMRDAELQWFGKTILPNIEKDLGEIGVPAAMSADPRVKAYFSDRMIQYGEKSILTYQNRISAAAEKAGDNPVAFLQNLTESDRANYRTDFRTAIRSGVYGEEGSNTRLNGRLRAALGIGEEGREVPQYGGPYPNLSLSQRQRLLNVAKVANRALVQQSVRDATAQIRNTGEAPKDEKGRTALDRAKLSLTPNEYAKAQLDWQEAEAEHKAVSPLANMPHGDAIEHIDKLTPGHELSDEHYAIADKVQKKADAAWKKIQQQRETDPAAAVETSPEVNEARHTLTVAGNRVDAAQRNEMLIEARRNAQERLGIPKFQQRILTEAEAAELLQIPRNPDNPDDIDQAINAAAQRAEQLYGKYAMEALDSAVAVHLKGGKDTRQAARDLVSSLKAQREAPPPKPSFWQSLFGGGTPAPEGKQPGKEGAAPAAPNTPPAAVPKPAQIEWLMSDPQNRQAAFDSVFGPGATARVLQAQELNRKQGVR